MKVIDLKNLLQNHPDDWEVIDCKGRPIEFCVVKTTALAKGRPNLQEVMLSVANPFIPKDYKKGEDSLKEAQVRANLEKQLNGDEVAG